MKTLLCIVCSLTVFSLTTHVAPIWARELTEQRDKVGALAANALVCGADRNSVFVYLQFGMKELRTLTSNEEEWKQTEELIRKAVSGALLFADLTRKSPPKSVFGESCDSIRLRLTNELSLQIEKARDQEKASAAAKLTEDLGSYSVSILSGKLTESELAETFALRAAAFLRLGMGDFALWDSKESIRLRPDDVPTLTTRGVAYLSRGEDKRALEDFSRAISIDKKYALAYQNRGIAYQRLGKRYLAMKNFAMARQLDPEDPHFEARVAEQRLLLSPTLQFVLRPGKNTLIKGDQTDWAMIAETPWALADLEEWLQTAADVGYSIRETFQFLGHTGTLEAFLLHADDLKEAKKESGLPYLPTYIYVIRSDLDLETSSAFMKETGAEDEEKELIEIAKALFLKFKAPYYRGEMQLFIRLETALRITGGFPSRRMELTTKLKSGEEPCYVLHLVALGAGKSHIFLLHVEAEKHEARLKEFDQMLQSLAYRTLQTSAD